MTKNKTKKSAITDNMLKDAVLNELSTRTALMQSLLDPRRDLDTECGYTVNPRATDYNEMYDKEGIAKRVVHILPEESWLVYPTIYEVEEPKDTAFETAWRDLNKRFSLFSVLSRADALSGIGRFGVILLGLDDGEELDKPVKPGPRKLLYLRVFDESVVKIQQSVIDTKNERFGFPLMYEITFENTTEGNTTSVSKNVHYSRIVHIADNKRMSEVLGVSRLRSVFNQILNLRKLLGSSPEGYWQAAFPGYSLEIDPNLLASGTSNLDSEAIKASMQDFINTSQRWLNTVGVSVKTLAPQIVDPTPHVIIQLKIIAITLGMPFRIFMGTEEGKLAGGQDSKAWVKRIAGRQNDYITPRIILPFIKQLIEYQILPEPEEINVDWPDMLAPSDQEKADVQAVIIKTLREYIQGDVQAIIAPKRLLVDFMGYDEEQADMIIEEVMAEEELNEEAIEEDNLNENLPDEIVKDEDSKNKQK